MRFSAAAWASLRVCALCPARANVSDYGSMLTLSMPFEWVTDDGTRFGFEVDIGRAFGGKITARCEFDPCTPGDEQELDRPAAPAFFAAFQLGWGFNHPPAKYPESRAVH